MMCAYVWFVAAAAAVAVALTNHCCPSRSDPGVLRNVKLKRFRQSKLLIEVYSLVPFHYTHRKASTTLM